MYIAFLAMVISHS